jgi:iron(III) transport system ATP-binding protein
MIDDVAALLDLAPELLRKRPGQLSGGQQQRVALARALVGKPEVVLFDEPLSNLDARLREQLRSDLRSLHQRVGFTGVYVTHDLAEALTIGDRVAVMGGGKIVQIGSPLEVFDRPVNVSTAMLLGFRRICTISAAGGQWVVADGVSIYGALPDISSAPGDLAMYVRPDRARRRVAGEGRPGMIVVSGGRVAEAVNLGTHSEVAVSLGPERPRLQIEVATGLSTDDQIDLEFDPADVRYYTVPGDLWPAV